MQLPHKFRGFVGGFGSGKTWVGCTAECADYWRYPRVNQGYFAPTYTHIRDIYFPTVEEVAFGLGLTVDIKEGNKEAHFYEGRRYRGTTICRSMDSPGSIVGFKIGRAGVDEIDTMPKDKAANAWRKIIARLRWEDARNGADVMTTPEGFGFAHSKFVATPAKRPEIRGLYGLIQASTFANAKNLPDDYIPSLMADYPEALVNAYLRGQFVNLTQGSVYPSFKRATCMTAERIQPGEALHIGMDFNVTKMAAVIHVIRGGRPYALDEFAQVFDTPAMVAKIKAKYPDRSIFVYPDASGSNRKSQNASESDVQLLQAAKFLVLKNPANPAVKDRVLAMNKAFEDGYFVNPDTCPHYVEGLEQQAYDAYGEPDKSGGFDHSNDAGGYFIAYKFPIPSRQVQRIRVGGT